MGSIPDVVRVRRDLHRYPELGWMEFRTARFVAASLRDLGFEVQLGRQVLEPSLMAGLPDQTDIRRHWKAVRDAEGSCDMLQAMKDGLTGVVGLLAGAGPGPTLALRFDMDALPIQESRAPGHYPCAMGFVSSRAGLMHACGHDGHTAIGWAVARRLRDLQSQIRGTVKLIFQPAEEGARGGSQHGGSRSR